MKAAVIVFPGSNCDRDLAVALRAAGAEVAMVWHKDTACRPGSTSWRSPAASPSATICAAAPSPPARR